MHTPKSHLGVMDATAALCADALHKFPEFPAAELEYARFLSRAVNSSADKSAKSDVGYSLSEEIKKARERIKTSLDSVSKSHAVENERIDELEKIVTTLIDRISQLELQIQRMRSGDEDVKTVASPVTGAQTNGGKASPHKGDDDDLFGSDSEDDARASHVRAERQAAYDAKKAKKPAVIAKSSLLIDVKPWSDKTDMAEMERLVRGIEADGLVWSTSKLVPLAFGINKLQIGCVIEDDKICTDFLEEEITKFDDHVQSMDIAAFNKV